MAYKGINLGGWLIAERWMTPALFDGVMGNGERAIGRELPAKIAAARIKAHRESFITEKDFAWIASRGFDFVRLPVGYWLFEEADGFVQGEEYVQQAFKWAQKHHLKVVLDFHGLQGSQNGQDHSGQVGEVRFYKRHQRSRALVTVEYLTKHYGHDPALLAIELINEPKVHWFIFTLVRYYARAYKIAAANVRPDVKIIVSDAFKPLRVAKALARRHLGEQLVLDVHLYQLFSAHDQALSFQGHLDKIELDWRPLLAQLAEQVPILVGEWSAALPVENTSEVISETQYQRYLRAQSALFDELSWGYSYWSYKAPGTGPWSYRDAFSKEK